MWINLITGEVSNPRPRKWKNCEEIFPGWAVNRYEAKLNIDKKEWLLFAFLYYGENREPSWKVTIPDHLWEQALAHYMYQQL